jgi:glycosyltransferase involved in cell wall biosynthesis
MKILSVVVPCYNEEAVLRQTNSSMLALIARLVDAGKIADTSCIYYVDDGSKDGTWSLIEIFARESKHVAGLKLSRNRGHQNALLAGLFNVPGDLVVSIDADLQDDLDAIEYMIDAHIDGCEIVYGVRDDRTTDTPFKRFTAEAFYGLLARLGVDVVHNHADYRLMTRRAIEALKDYREVNLFLRGIIPLIGFKSSVVHYKRGLRYAGDSKYPLKKMLSLAWEGVTSMSIVPLRLVTATGAIVFALTVLISLCVVGIRLFTNQALPGWTSTVLPIYLLGGIQILCIGILGEYLGKVYQEVKARPRFVIERKCGANYLLARQTAGITMPPSEPPVGEPDRFANTNPSHH